MEYEPVRWQTYSCGDRLIVPCGLSASGTSIVDRGPSKLWHGDLVLSPSQRSIVCVWWA